MNPPFGFFKFVVIVALMFYVAGRAIVPGFLRDVNPMIVGVLVYAWYRWARTKDWWPKPTQDRGDAPKQVQVPHGALLEKLKQKARVSQKRETGRSLRPPPAVAEQRDEATYDAVSADESKATQPSKEGLKRIRVKAVRKKVIRARRAKMDRDC